MTRFLAANWLWILLIGGMLYMHLGHGRRGHGGHMGHGMSHAQHDDHPVERKEQEVNPHAGHDLERDDQHAASPGARHRGC